MCRVIGFSDGKNLVQLKNGDRLKLTDEELAAYKATGDLPEKPSTSPKPNQSLADRVIALEDRIAALEARLVAPVEMEMATLEGISIPQEIEDRLTALEEALTSAKPAEETPADAGPAKTDEAKTDEENTLSPDDAKKGKAAKTGAAE